MLKSSSTKARSVGKLLLEGIKMMRIGSSSNAYNFTSSRYTATGNTVSLDGETYSSYQFQNGGFNFTVSKPGILTMILGTYASTSALHSGLDLYQVTRDGDHNITSCDESTRIKQIYVSSDGNEISYNSPSGNATDLSIDMDAIASSTGVLTANCAYYLEIPVTAGDYFLSKIYRSDSNSSQLPYVLYLDIGANAGDKKEEKIDPDPTNIDFVYKNDGAIVKITDDGYVPSGVNFSFKGTNSSGWLYFKRNTSTGGVFFCVLTDSGYTVTSAGSGTKTGKSSKEDYDAATA